MTKKLYPEESVSAIAEAIRSKNGSTDTYKISDMATAIENIPTGGEKPDFEGNFAEGSITINKNPEKYNKWYYMTQNMRSLQKLFVAEGVTEIVGFSSCTDLAYAELPSTLTYISNYTFDSCNNLKTVVCKATTPPYLAVSHGLSSDCEFYVPDESVDTYKTVSSTDAGGWDKVVDHIHPMSELPTNS